jgi:Na+/H+-dicarboxylate symporter
MFRKMPFILLAVIALAALANPYLPDSCKSILYGISLSIKSLIIFTLPFLIFGLMFKTAVNIARKATKMILWILAAVSASSFIALLASYLVGSAAFGMHLSMAAPQEVLSLQPSWALTLPKWIGNDYAMLSGLLAGVLLARCKPFWADGLSLWLEKIVSRVLKAILYLIPVFIAGFVVKLSHDQVMGYILQNYSLIFGLIACAVFSYIVLLYLAINRFQWRIFIQNIKNMLPAAIAGFGSMSSAASMPLTILGAEKNAKNPELARSIIPATVNIHLIGDCFATPIFAFAILNHFGMAEPTLLQYLVFAFYFILAKFSVAAVPGGGILVMLPILESYLGFDAQMLSLITALYILFDPVITCANVLGNGGFALGMDKVFKKSIEVRT